MTNNRVSQSVPSTVNNPDGNNNGSLVDRINTSLYEHITLNTSFGNLLKLRKELEKQRDTSSDFPKDSLMNLDIINKEITYRSNLFCLVPEMDFKELINVRDIISNTFNDNNKKQYVNNRCFELYYCCQSEILKQLRLNINTDIPTNN